MENKKFFAEERGFCVQKKFLAYLSTIFLVFFLLKKLDLFQFSQGIGDIPFVFLPVALVLGVIGWNFWQMQNLTKENLRKNIFQKTLFLNLNLVWLCLAFYFLYSPESFFPFFVAVIFFVRKFFTLESFFFFFSTVSLLVVVFSLSLVFLQFYRKNKSEG